MSAYLDRLRGVTLSRMRGPTARKATRWWVGERSTVNVKAVDTAYIVPAKLVEEIDAALRPVLTRIAADAAAWTVERFAARSTEGAEAIEPQRAVDEAMHMVSGVAHRYAEVIRERIATADTEAVSLPDMLDRVGTAYAASRERLLVAGQVVGAALRGDVTIRSAQALGITHAQWLAEPDAPPTHRAADGQVRVLGEPFTVGAFRLRYPGDPADLPDSWAEVAHCRCGLRLGRPDPARVATPPARRTQDDAAALRR